MSATRLGPVCDQDSLMEFGLDQLGTGLQPGSSYLDMSRYLEPGRRLVRSQIPLRYPRRRPAAS